jgi:hypothetical protein
MLQARITKCGLSARIVGERGRGVSRDGVREGMNGDAWRYGQEAGPFDGRWWHGRERRRGMDGGEEEKCGKLVITPGTLAWTSTRCGRVEHYIRTLVS